MEGAAFKSPKNSGQVFKLEIKHKNAHTKKRKVKTWSPEEDDQLVRLYEEYPKKWGLIASMMQDRNENQCLHRYRRLSQLGAHKKIWSAEQDQTILLLIKKVGKNWKRLAELIGTKTGKQIRQRFINKLDPRIKNEEWTDQEDKLILKYFSEVGSKWSEISKKLPGRPQNKIKNRFYSYIQKNYDIRYVCVNADEIEAEAETESKMRKNSLKDSQVRASYCDPIPSLQELGEKPMTRSQKPTRLQQLTLNERLATNSPIKKRKCRNRSSYSRFSKQNQENIFEDEQEKEQQAKMGSQAQVQGMPSIKELEDEFKISGHPASKLELPNLHCFGDGIDDEKDGIFDSNANLGQKFYIKSLIRVEEDYGLCESRYRSIRDLVSNGEIENNENELLYLSQH